MLRILVILIIGGVIGAGIGFAGGIFGLSLYISS